MQWLEMLQQQVKDNGLRAVAERLGVSTSTVSQVTNEKYPGDVKRVQTLVESVYLDKNVMCPVLGEIPWHLCQQHQKNHYTGNPQKLRLYRACRSGCSHSDLPTTQNAQLLAHPQQASRGAEYDAEAVINRLKRQINTDGGNAIGLSELLEDELKALASRYNRALRTAQSSKE
ncbi:hypothetical protein L1D40_07190 [Shewanella insulae]|uniref:hypothetical protein n=1 Tax=Shewanella insulae TaxID=2681496 RepID=UPI001EFCD2D0|nr:hypothetical protein [Shewanella insulae]MCG9755005.1 hypothetical protein [Shewanella insulae]